MNDRFFEQKKEKQDRIINAAFKIFSNVSYKHGSTDDIVAEAEISKGLLFHYFVSKEGLYTFLYDYSVRFISMELSTTVSVKETDYFELKKQIETAHYNVMKNYPYLLSFVDRASIEADIKIKKEIEDKKTSLNQLYDDVLKRADGSHLKNSFELERIIKLADYTVSGISKAHFRKAKPSPKLLYQEKMDYLDILKSACNEEIQD